VGPEGGKPIRAFLAVEVAEEVHTKLVALKRALAGEHREVRWVRDEALHATVKFLGAVRLETMERIEAKLREELHGQKAFVARVEAVRAFPSLRHPQIVWVGVHADELRELAARVERCLQPLGFEPENRAFHGHVTLGRVRRGKRVRGLSTALESHAGDSFGQCRIGELAAFESHLREGGSVYTKLWSIPFEE